MWLQMKNIFFVVDQSKCLQLQLVIPNAVNVLADQYLYIFLACVRCSAVYCNSFQCGVAADVFPEKEICLL